MRINLHDQVKRTLNIQKISQVNSKNFQKGEVLKGEILDIQQKNVLIKLSNGTALTAKLTDQMEFSIGQKLLFQVKDSNLEQVLLKPIMDESFNPKNNKLFQVLEEAGVTTNEKNTEIVNKLLDNNMPVDKEFINNLLRLSRQFKDTSIDKLILLMKNNIPVTKESIEQLDNYMDNNHSMKQEVLSLANRMIDHNDMSTKQEILRILISNGNEQMPVSDGNHVAGDEGVTEGVKNQEPIGLQLGNILPDTTIKELENELNNTYLLKGNNTLNLSKELTLQELQQEIFTLDMKEEDKADMHKMITNRLLESAVDKNIFLGKGALENPKLINDYFNGVYEKIVNIIRFTEGTIEGKRSSIMKDATKVKNNIDFMNQLNNNYNYVQLPFKFNNKLLNSELYIFENKKELRAKRPTDSISALLRLDYVNLGHMDVYIAKQAKNIDCKFYVEDEEKKNILNNHLSHLYKRIKSFDYNITGLMVINNKKDFDFIEDFVSRKDEAKGVKRYTFDMRV